MSAAVLAGAHFAYRMRDAVVRRRSSVHRRMYLVRAVPSKLSFPLDLLVGGVLAVLGTFANVPNLRAFGDGLLAGASRKAGAT